MKLVYVQPEKLFKNLYKQVPEGITVVEVIDPDRGWAISTKEYIHDDVIQIKLWDEKKYGDNYERPFFLTKLSQELLNGFLWRIIQTKYLMKYHRRRI